MAGLDGLGLQFTESMVGYLGPDRAAIRFDVQIHTADLARFLRVPDHAAELTGIFTMSSLGGTFPIRDGRFNPKARQDADFRVSFAKNKTHAYAFYTLTLKNIYGALPLANKFKEYRCKRGICHPAIESLKAFPVDYGLVDAFVSADGPFGIFADPAPNETGTAIGGADLLAVDWVAATKIGIDPMISQYIRLAVEAFGKPRIRLVGDASAYWPWLNVPVALNLFTHKGMDADYHFGNLLYSAASQMDETHFHHKSKALYIRILRRLTVPLRRTFFLRTGENPSFANRLVSRLLYRMGY